MFADQDMNCRNAMNQGFLVHLDWANLTEESLMTGIQELLNSNKYRDNVRRLSNIFKDQPDDPLQRGVYWVEYVLRHNGAPHLRSPARKLNWFQYHSLDVIGAYISIISGTLYILYATLRWIFRKLCGKSKTPASSSKKNQ